MNSLIPTSSKNLEEVFEQQKQYKKGTLHIVVDEQFYLVTIVMNHSTSMNLQWFSSGTLQLWNIFTLRKKRIFSGVVDWKTVCSGSRVKQNSVRLNWNRKSTVIMNLTQWIEVRNSAVVSVLQCYRWDWGSLRIQADFKQYQFRWKLPAVQVQVSQS